MPVLKIEGGDATVPTTTTSVFPLCAVFAVGWLLCEFLSGLHLPKFPHIVPSILSAPGSLHPLRLPAPGSLHPLRFPARPREQLFIVHKERAIGDFDFSGRRKSRRGRFPCARRFVGGKKAPFDAASHPAAAEDSVITVRIIQCRPS